MSELFQKANFWKRIVALIIDQGIILILLFFFFISANMSKIHYDGWEEFVYWIISSIYGSLMISRSGATYGKKLVKIKVLSDSYQPVSLGKALLRESVGKFLSSAVFSIGYLIALTNKEHQTWHDKIAHTFVLELDKHNNLIPVTEEHVTTQDKITFWILNPIVLLPVILSFFVIMYLFLFQPHEIRGVGMNPSYREGQYYLSNKLIYRYQDPKRYDVIVFKSVTNPDNDYFKRIIGLPGETVEIRGGSVLINGKIPDEPYLANDTITRTYEGAFMTEGRVFTIPQGHYFVLGDNRDRSSDSREFGPVPRENIIGKMTFCYWNCNPTLNDTSTDRSN